MIQLGYDRPFHRYLLPNEQLLWVGRPRQGMMLRASDRYAIPLTLCAGAWVIYCGVGIMRPFTARRITEIRWLGLPVIAIGLYLIIFRFIHDAWRRRHTWYALTDRRALFLYRGKTVHLYGVDLVDTSEIELKEHADGAGTIVFIEPKVDPYWAGRVHAIASIGQSQQKSFEGIQDAREVCALIDRTRTHPSPSRSADSARCSAAAPPP